jgi:hypothetical protein
MPRDGAIIFRDIVGKLDVFNIEFDKCGRRGRYHVHRLIERYGIDARLFDWSDEITADCLRKIARSVSREMLGPFEGGLSLRNGVSVYFFRMGKP